MENTSVSENVKSLGALDLPDPPEESPEETARKNAPVRAEIARKMADGSYAREHRATLKRLESGRDGYGRSVPASVRKDAARQLEVGRLVVRGVLTTARALDRRPVRRPSATRAPRRARRTSTTRAPSRAGPSDEGPADPPPERPSAEARAT